MLLMLAMAQLWNLLAGYTGLVSMGLQCFVGLGGYTTIFAANTLSVSPYLVLPLAPIVCGLIGAVSALFLFRLRDAYFSISTWVFAEVVAMLVFIAPGLGHVTGMTLTTARGIDYETFLLANFWIAAALAAGVAIGIYALLHSPLGLGMLSVRDDDIAAASIGVNVWRNRFIAYVAAAAGCGLAGGISFMAALFITVTTGFDLNWVVAMIFIVIIGGIGTLEGPIVGTAIYYGIRELLTNVFALSGSWYLVTLGAVAVTAMLIAPRGIWPFIRDRFGIEWLSISRKLADAATPAGAATITPEAAQVRNEYDKGKCNGRHDTSTRHGAIRRRPDAGRLRPRADLQRHDRRKRRGGADAGRRESVSRYLSARRRRKVSGAAGVCDLQQGPARAGCGECAAAAAGMVFALGRPARSRRHQVLRVARLCPHHRLAARRRQIGRRRLAAMGQLRSHRMDRAAAMVRRQCRDGRHFRLRRRTVVRGAAKPAASESDLSRSIRAAPMESWGAFARNIPAACCTCSVIC